MRLRKSAIAEQDLFGIWDYIANDSPTAADRFLLRPAERFQSLLRILLAANPKIVFEPDSGR